MEITSRKLFFKSFTCNEFYVQYNIKGTNKKYWSNEIKWNAKEEKCKYLYTCLLSWNNLKEIIIK